MPDMTWTPEVYHKIIMVDLQQLAQEIGSYSKEQDLASQRYRFQEIVRFASKINENARLGMNAIARLEQEKVQRKIDHEAL